MVQIVGKYTMASSENFDEFMKAVGVGLVMRKMANASSPSVDITEADGKYSLKTVTTFKTTEINFKLGEEFDETTADGRTVKSIVTMDGSKMVHKQVGDKAKSEKDSTLTREFTEEGLNMECQCGEVISKRVYKRE